jgi:hypothetical protein
MNRAHKHRGQREEFRNIRGNIPQIGDNYPAHGWFLWRYYPPSCDCSSLNRLVLQLTSLGSGKLLMSPHGGCIFTQRYKGPTKRPRQPIGKYIFRTNIMGLSLIGRKDLGRGVKNRTIWYIGRQIKIFRCRHRLPLGNRFCTESD